MPNTLVSQPALKSKSLLGASWVNHDLKGQLGQVLVQILQLTVVHDEKGLGSKLSYSVGRFL